MAANVLKRILTRKHSQPWSDEYNRPEGTLPVSYAHRISLRYASGRTMRQPRVTESTARRLSTVELPIELWQEVLMHIDDCRHLVNVALVCRSLRDVALEKLSRREISADTLESVRALCAAATTSHRFTGMVRCLAIRCYFRLDDALVPVLTPSLKAFRNLNTLTLDIPAASFAEKCVRNGLLDTRLPALSTLRTTLYTSHELLDFISAHPSLTLLALLSRDHKEPTADASRPQISLPSLQKLGCDGPCLRYFSCPCTLSELYLVSCSIEQLETISTTLGPYIRRLHFGPIGIIAPRHMLTLQHFLSWRFPRLEYLQTCVDTEEMCGAIGWRGTPTPPIRCNRSVRLIVAWILAPNLLDDPCVAPRALGLLHRNALHVLRTWSPYVDQVIFGSGSKLLTAVTLSRDRTFLIDQELEDANGGRRNTPWHFPLSK